MTTITQALELRPIVREELDEFLATGGPTFGESAGPEDLSYWSTILDPARTVAIFDRSRIVATAEAQPLDLTIPGSVLPTAGLTSGRVLPSHRRRGLITRLVWHLLDQAKDRGEPLAGLWASESSIYGRHGFGWATTAAHLEIARQHAALARPVDNSERVHILGNEDVLELLPSIYDQVRAEVPGMLSRSEARWRGWIHRDPEHWRDGFWREGTGPKVIAAWEDRGYISYRLQRRWASGGPECRVLVAELMAVDPESYRGMWQWCFDLDLATSFVAAQRSPREPIRMLLADPRRMLLNTTDALWIRILDPILALTARRYASDGKVVIQIVDEAGYANGRYRLDVHGGSAECVKANHTADVELPVSSLSGAYLGGMRMLDLARAGKATESTPGALQRLDRMLEGDIEPWSPWVF